MTQQRYPVAVYNVGPIGEAGRRPDDLERECNGILRTKPEPVVIVLIETCGWGSLFALPGMVKIRDTKTEGRANITMYISKSLGVETISWHARDIEWERTEHDARDESTDNHWAREDLKVYDGKGNMWGGAHQPPRGIRSTRPPHTWITDAAQQEGIDYWAQAMAPWLRPTWDNRSDASQKRAKDRLRTLLWDPNRDPNARVNQPGPNMLARKIEGWRAGTAIEGGVVRGGQFERPRKQAVVGGVKMGSDHKGLFLATVVTR